MELQLLALYRATQLDTFEARPRVKTTTLLANACFLAWADTKARYKKSALGPLWIVLTNLIGVLGLSIIWARLFKQPVAEFAPTLALGLIVWQLLASILIDAPVAFVRESRMIRNVSLPVWFFAFRLLMKHVITFLHNLLIVAGVVWYFALPVGWGWLLSALAIVLMFANLFCMVCLLGLLGARFRDIELAIQAFVPLLFFFTPVMFKADTLPDLQLLIWSNPLSYFVEAFRAPLLGQDMPHHPLLVMAAMLLVLSVITTWTLKTVGRRVAFWV